MKNFNSLKIYLIILVLGLSIFYHKPALSEDNKFELSIGEELTYKVKWAFIRLGTLKYQLLDTLRQDGNLVYHLRLYIDSNPMLFFVNMHSVFETYMGDRLIPYKFIAYEKIDNINYLTEHHFNYKDSTMQLTMTDIEDTTHIIKKTRSITKSIYDALTLVYYARSKVENVDIDTLSTFFGEEIGDIVINFRGQKAFSLSDFEDEFDISYFIDGTILMKGIAGLTGPYLGWFGGSKRRIPLKAEMKVFVGNVIVELEKISRVAADSTKVYPD